MFLDEFLDILSKISQKYSLFVFNMDKLNEMEEIKRLSWCLF